MTTSDPRPADDRLDGPRPDPRGRHAGRSITPEHAEAIARNLLRETLPRRWAHTEGVAAAACSIAHAYPGGEVLVASAWLHDIGYAPALADSGTGFHPLDGARYLRDVVGAATMVGQLVAHHSYALAGAAELGLADDLAAEFPAPPGDLADAMTFCDMTTGPDGQTVPVAQRLVEIRARYGPGHVVTRTIMATAADITAAAERTSAILSASSSQATPRPSTHHHDEIARD